MKNKASILNAPKVIFAFSVILILLISIPSRLAYLYTTKGDEYKEKAKRTSIINQEKTPTKGNIYDQEGNLLLTSLPIYTAAVDPSLASEKLLNQLDDLSSALSEMFPKSYPDSDTFSKKYLKSRALERQYLVIQRRLNYTQIRKLRTLPILKERKIKGGFITQKEDQRKKPFGELASRTLGKDVLATSKDVGLEGFYHSEISGEKGFEMVQKISGGGTKPLPSPKDIESVDGADLVTYLDIRIQDLCHNSLLQQLEKYQAESGSVILMETKTGAIKAMVNLKRGRDSLYRETQNFAVGAATEPGSTFKLFSYMVAMEDGHIDTNDLIETGNGIRTFHGQTMRDSHRGGFGEITVKEAFELSSNIAIAQLIEDHYSDDPQRFVDRLARFGLHEPVGVDIPGEAHPKIKQTSDKTWSKVSLPWMAYGYEVSLSPIQILTFYNAIANEGEMIKPKLVKEIQRAGRRIKTIPKEVLNPKICSDATLGKLKAMMEGAVEHGTAKNIYSEQFSSAGKTGTCQVEYWKKNRKRVYQSSFAGYFPKEDPKYSCIVVVQKPNTSIGFYGNVVAAPVFETVRNALFTENTQDYENQDDILFSKLPKSLNGSANQFNELAELMDWKSEIEHDNQLIQIQNEAQTFKTKTNYLVQETSVPNLVGLTSKEARFILENLGLKVETKGMGKVVKQSLAESTPIQTGDAILLTLDI